jgi:hypothetical protein
MSTPSGADYLTGGIVLVFSGSSGANQLGGLHLGHWKQVRLVVMVFMSVLFLYQRVAA